MAAEKDCENSAEHTSLAAASTAMDTAVAQVELSPEHTPHSSKVRLVQHTPPESSTPTQHVPCTTQSQ